MKKYALFLLSLILLGAFVVRLYRFDGPIADWHSWRQADTASVSRSYAASGVDFLHPTFDDLSNIPSGIDNPKGYRFVEFPLYNALQATLFTTLHVFTLEQWGRLITIFASLSSVVFLYLLVKKYQSISAALLTAFFFAFVPYNIYYGRTILPDPSMAAAMLGGIYFFDKWLEKVNPKSKIPSSKSWVFFILAMLFTAGAFLLKPYALFFTLPMIVLVYEKYGFSFWKKWQLWVFAIVSLLPLIFWRQWIAQFPEGIPANAWLLNGNGIRFRPAFFRWIFYERVTHIISGYFGIALLVCGGLLLKAKKKFLFFTSFIVASLLYLVVFATGNVQHDYYQILIMPTLAILYGLGAEYLLTKKKMLLTILFFVSTAGMLVFGWYVIRDYFNINNPSLMVAGKAVDALTPKNAKVLAIYGGDTTFLYQTKRQGWPSFEKPIPEMIKMGASYVVFVNPTKTDYEFAGKYKTVASTKEYLLVNIKDK